jgi:hypothetical protein
MAKRRRGSPTLIQQSRGVSSEEKAMFHNVLGAGRRGTIRAFFDASPEDGVVLMKKLEQQVAARLKKAGA